MNDAWFNPNAYAWIPGTLVGIFGAIEGTLAGVLAPKGKGRNLVFALHTVFIIISALFLIAGIIALAMHQPYGIWYGFILAGVIGTIVFASLTSVIKRQYKNSDWRKTMANDL